LNLLAIPAIVFVYYFRKYKVTRKGIVWALVTSIALLGGVMYVIIPGTVKLASVFELMFVNGFGLPYHSGVYFYCVLLIASFSFGIYYTYKKQKAILNTILLGIAVILIGYSSFAIVIIRSSAKPPMDQNSPNNTFGLLSYLNRDQYGSRPLFKGQYYNSPYKTGDRYTEGNPVYSQVDGKYEITYRKINPNYDEKFTTIFPRMWSSTEPQHAKDYQEWAKIKGTRIKHTNENGETETIIKPTFGENLRFFFSYQVNFMYWRYFMWNFVGRQNDIQGHGGVLHGNWISGIKFIDNARLGDQDNLPSSLANNKAHNTYFFLPFILGILGIFFQFNRGQEGRKGLWLVFLLFFMTGLAIVIYLNQYPHQPRERDYAYAGSFYAFAIWVGLGVLAISETLKKYIPEKIAASLAGLITLILVPGIMGAQNWDDHDRSGRYTCRDFGANYLKTCQPNGIIFTNGDNDTFPLWYNQEVEGVRTDMRVCNLSYFQTDWYADQMRRKAYESEPFKFSLKSDQYRLGTRDAVYLFDDSRVKRNYIGLKEAVDFIANDNPATKLQQADNAAYLPKKILHFKVDKEAVLRNHVVAPEDSDKIVDEIVIDLSNKSMLTKDEMLVLDMLANNCWDRPIYWSITVGSNKYLNLGDYFQLEGFAYRLVPIKTPSNSQQMEYGCVNTDLMYDNLMNKYKWGNMNDPNVYLDETNTRMMSNIRNSFYRLASALVSEGKKDSAITVLDKCNELITQDAVPYAYFALQLADCYAQAGAKDKASTMLNNAYNQFNDELSYYFSLDVKFINTQDISEEIQRSLFYMQRVMQIADKAGEKELSKKAEDTLHSYLGNFRNS
jgi:tetratricopeptide (TPR) repeat protein